YGNTLAHDPNFWSGLIQFGGGIAGGGGGLALAFSGVIECGTGVLCLAGVPSIVGGLGIAAAGYGTAQNGADLLGKAFSEASSEAAGSSTGAEGSVRSYSPEDLTRVSNHLGRPEPDHSPADDAMIDGIRQGMADGPLLSEGEQNLMRHELTEAGMMDGGMSYEDAHELALQTHPLMKNYTPEVIDQFPEMFNDNWRRAWGLEPR
ncbi:hypothetical protein ACWDQO_36140, partial [Streptomyces sp. NPDC003703]